MSGSADLSLTISFVKKESFKPNLKGREGVCFPDIYYQLVPQERGLITEGSAYHSTFRNLETCSLWAKCSVRKMSYNKRYDGARSLRALYVRRRILHSILNLTGSQWREAKTGEIWSLLLVLIRTLAAAFWISWRLFREFVRQPNNKELQSSHLEVKNAWTSFSATGHSKPIKYKKKLDHRPTYTRSLNRGSYHHETSSCLQLKWKSWLRVHMKKCVLIKMYVDIICRYSIEDLYRSKTYFRKRILEEGMFWNVKIQKSNVFNISKELWMHHLYPQKFLGF